MKNSYIVDLKEEAFYKHKDSLCKSAAEMYSLGYPLAVIIDILYNRFKSKHKKFTKTAVRDLVWISAYEFAMKEKQQGN